MNGVLDVLKGYLGKNVSFVKTEEDEDLFDGINVEIYDNENEESIGVCIFNADDKLTNYYLTEETADGNLTSKDMQPIAEKFIEQFYPRGLEEYKLQSVIDLEDTYMITYGIKDDTYGIDLPGIGFTLTISTSGEVVQFSYDHDSAHVEYPETMITEEEAKEKYASLIHFEKVIQYTDRETYVNGDDMHRVVYSVREAAVDIPASGGDAAVVEEGNMYKKVNPQDVPLATIYEMIGITEEHILLGEYESEDCMIEKWMHCSLPFPETIDYTEAYDEQIITIHFDLESNKPTFVYNGEAYTKEKEALDNDQLNQRALDFLFLLYPQSDEHFMQEVEDYIEEDWLEEDDAEYEDEYEEEWDEDLEEVLEEEDSVPFYFQYYVNNIPVESCVTCIQVGMYSGNIISASIEPVNEKELTIINTDSTISMEEAKEIFMDKVKMELTMAQEFNEEGESYFIPTYLPAFPETVGHVHMIDAETGKAYYVDIGDSNFI